MTESYRPEFLAVLRKLAEAFDRATRRGARLPVIVGGAAVEFYTMSIVQSGDVDLVSFDDAILVEELEQLGFRRSSPGSLRNLYHPELVVAVDFVSGPLFDGRTDRGRMMLVDLDATGSRILLFPPVEDRIADRLAQFESAPAGVPEMLEQARVLYRPAVDRDRPYLLRRVAEECFDREIWRPPGAQ
jgi:hypothetical protein